MLRILAIICILTLATSLQAQDSTRVDTTSRTIIFNDPTDPFKTPRSISVITLQEIAAANVRTLPELLSQYEGIYIHGLGLNPGGTQTLFMRGMNNNQTLIMIDGVPFNDPSSPNYMLDISDIALNNIERIEIIRGSNGVINGSGSMGGSINIITKGKGEKEYEASGAIRIGDGYTNAGAYANYTDKSGVYGSVGINNISSRGFDATMDTSTQKPLEERDKDAFHQSDVTGKFGYEHGKLNISFMGKQLEKHAETDSAAFINDNNYTVDTKRNLYHFEAAYKLNSKLTIGAHGAYSTNSFTVIKDSLPDTTNHSYSSKIFTGNSMVTEARVKYINNGFSFWGGLGMYSESMNHQSGFYNSSVPDSSTANLKDSNSLKQSTVFVHARANYNFKKQGAEPLNIAIGIRYSAHNQYGRNLCFEFSPSYTKNGNSIYFTHNNGFLNPSIYQLYAGIPGEKTIANKNLSPQYSRSYEIGFKTIIDKSVYFTVSVFRIDVQDPIHNVSLWNKNKSLDSLDASDFRGSVFLNLGKQQNNGIDFSLNIKTNSQWSMALRYSYVMNKTEINSKDMDTNLTSGHHLRVSGSNSFVSTDKEMLNILQRPTNMMYAIVNYRPSNSINFRLDSRFVSERISGTNAAPSSLAMNDIQTLNRYMLVDFYAKYFISNTISVGLKVDNLLNTNYTEVTGYRTMGTKGYLDLMIKL